MRIRTTIINSLRVAMLTLTAGLLLAPLQASAAPATPAMVGEAQTILTKLKIPTGPIDKDFGGQTARGLCTFRLIAGLKPSRNNVDASLLAKMRKYQDTYGSLAKTPAPTLKGSSTYVLVDKTCQILLYVEGGTYVRAIAASTGKAGHTTPDSTKYRLNNTEKGWKCSGDYPDNKETGTCNKQSSGEFGTSTSRGNMYNRRHIVGGYFVHGSMSVPTYPASHGCIRIPVPDSDWMFHNVGNSSDPRIIIQGAY